jgi:DNA invertase Pin-like site-specific DNA recombinase
VRPCPAGDGAGPWALQAVTLAAELRERGIGLHVIEQGTDTDTMEGRAMFGMLSVQAELRHELIVANTMDGLATARARGRIAGQSGTGPKKAEGQMISQPPAARIMLLAKPIAVPLRPGPWPSRARTPRP